MAAVGYTLIGIGLICNPWMLTWLFSSDGEVALANKIIIGVFELLSLLAGWLLISNNRNRFVYLAGAYQNAAAVTFNTIILIGAINLGIYIYEILSRTVSEKMPSLQGTMTNRLFSEDGSPVDNGRRTGLQKDWFDFTAYGDHDPSYVGQLLDDFDALA